MLGVAASWLIQVGVDLYRFIKPMFKSKDEDIDGDKTKQVGPLAPKIVIATIRCTSSLIFASIGAGIGATIVRPSLGQWIGKFFGFDSSKGTHFFGFEDWKNQRLLL